jgi:flagellar biosynthesis protein FlhB
MYVMTQSNNIKLYIFIYSHVLFSYVNNNIYTWNYYFFYTFVFNKQPFTSLRKVFHFKYLKNKLKILLYIHLFILAKYFFLPAKAQRWVYEGPDLKLKTLDFYVESLCVGLLWLLHNTQRFLTASKFLVFLSYEVFVL